MEKKKILVIDDEENIVELIRMNLEGSGYEVITGYTGMEAITKTNSFLPDLILLDLMLPDIDGLQICQMLKKNQETKDIPVIMITAKSEESDKVEGLSIGADDYITKPFGIRELEARVNTVLRRTERKDSINIEALENPYVLKFKDITIDESKYEVKKKGQLIDLTLTEFRILKLLVENEDRVTTRESILEEISSDKVKSDSRTIDVHIRNLRKKLEEDTESEYIETIRGIGYRLK